MAAQTDEVKVSFTRMKSFVVTADVLQFRKAAEQLGISQAALSAQIRAFELEVGFTLFRRTTRSVRLTAEGERFLHLARKVLDELQSAVLDVRDQVQLKRGRLIIAATPSLASNLLPTAIAAFRAHYPNITVHVEEDRSSAVEQRVESGEADFGVSALAERRKALAFTFLCRDRFVGIVPLQHPLAKRSVVRLAQLLESPLLTSIPETTIKRSFEAILDERGLQVRRGQILTQHQTWGNPQTIVAMVAAGLGIAILPSLALAMLDRRPIAVVTIVDPQLTRDIGIIQRKGGSPSAAASEFLRMWAAQEIGH